MKKILSALLLVFVVVLSACGGIKYEYKDGAMYENGKKATGTFEFKSGKYKVKGKFVNGLPDGLFEEYYEDGSIMIKDIYTNGENIKGEIYYKNGQLMAISTDDEDFKIYYEDGKLIMAYNNKTGESAIYHENGNPLMSNNNPESIICNENNEILFKVVNGGLIEEGLTFNELEDGSFEVVKDNKVVSTMDANCEVVTYLYSTGELMIKINDTTETIEVFFKNGNIFMKIEGDKNILHYKDGKPLYEVERGLWKVYNEDGEEITSGFQLVTDIKKLD